MISLLWLMTAHTLPLALLLIQVPPTANMSSGRAAIFLFLFLLVLNVFGTANMIRGRGLRQTQADQYGSYPGGQHPNPKPQTNTPHTQMGSTLPPNCRPIRLICSYPPEQHPSPKLQTNTAHTHLGSTLTPNHCIATLRLPPLPPNFPV